MERTVACSLLMWKLPGSFFQGCAKIIFSTIIYTTWLVYTYDTSQKQEGEDEKTGIRWGSRCRIFHQWLPEHQQQLLAAACIEIRGEKIIIIKEPHAVKKTRSSSIQSTTPTKRKASESSMFSVLLAALLCCPIDTAITNYHSAYMPKLNTPPQHPFMFSLCRYRTTTFSQEHPLVCNKDAPNYYDANNIQIVSSCFFLTHITKQILQPCQDIYQTTNEVVNLQCAMICCNNIQMVQQFYVIWK